MILESADPRMALVARPAAKLLGDVLAGNDPAADVAVGTLEDSVESEHFAPRFTAGDLGSQSSEPRLREHLPATRPTSSSHRARPALGRRHRAPQRDPLRRVGRRILRVRGAGSDLGASSGHFDLSTFDVYGALHSGAGSTLFRRATCCRTPS